MIQIGNMKLLNLQDCNEKYAITVSLMRKAIKEGKLQAKKIGREWHMTEKQIADWLRSL